jgi:hypothetical protein
MTEYEIDPIQWFSQRELTFKPIHFYLTKTPVTTESKKWIVNKLKGRYCFVSVPGFGEDTLFDLDSCPAFEDQGEAVLYELTWS